MRRELQFQWQLSNLRSNEWPQREKASLALGELGDPRAVEPLCCLLLGRDSTSIFQSWLDRIVPPSSRTDPDALLPYGNDTDRYPVRVAAARSLGMLKDRRAVPALIAALEDPSSHVTCEAARALAHLRDDRAIHPLVSLLKSQEPGEAEAASATLGMMGTASIPWVAELLKSSCLIKRRPVLATISSVRVNSRAEWFASGV